MDAVCAVVVKENDVIEPGLVVSMYVLKVEANIFQGWGKKAVLEKLEHGDGQTSHL